jgi:hypothetical protein
VHLETRDAYTPSDPEFLDWQAGRPRPAPESTPWYGLVREHTARGVRFRRARVVSEPVTGYIRFEHETTAGLNIAAGEDVRWLPRRRASDLLLPGNDFWLFDDALVRFHYFSGDGEIVEDELCSDPAVIARVRGAFEAVWERAVPHADYRIA